MITTSYKQVVFFIFLVFFTSVSAQVGSSVYSFLELPVSSRIAALGGTNVSSPENDLNFAFRNPALLTVANHQQLSLSMANYLADIQFGTAMYGFTVNKKNNFSIGVQYIDYGSFRETDELNNEYDTFGAKDMALYVIYSRALTDKINVGGTFKPIYSVFERYTSYGVAVDAGISYSNPDKYFSAGLVLRNAGTQLKGYYRNEDGQHYEALPFEIQAGITKKLNHAPFRLSLTLHNLQRFNLNYLSSDLLIENATATNDISFVDMAFRHAIFGVEFVPGKNFYLAASYNHRRHSELKMPGFKSAAGFSFGGGLKIYKFNVGFGTSTFQAGNVAYQFSIATSLDRFKL